MFPVVTGALLPAAKGFPVFPRTILRVDVRNGQMYCWRAKKKHAHVMIRGLKHEPLKVMTSILVMLQMSFT